MTAREEIESWKVQHQNIKNEEERKRFFDNIEQKILAKNNSEVKEHLEAYKSSIDEFEKEVNHKTENSEIKVYPSSNEELELLKSLFSKMNIRFDLG